MADWNCNLCKEYQSGLACTYCDDGSEFVRMTNADRIRAMSDEELAEFISMVANDSMDTIANGIRAYEEIWEDKENTLQWLHKEV